MSDPSRPQLNDISHALAHLADRVLARKALGLEPYVAHTLRLAVSELELMIPGLDPVPNGEAARAFAEAAEIALANGDEREALSYALRGLSCSPHDPVLWYHAGAACIEVGSLEIALRLLWHALWIHPGYELARRDLDALTSFFERTAEDEAEGHHEEDRAA